MSYELQAVLPSDNHSEDEGKGYSGGTGWLESRVAAVLISFHLALSNVGFMSEHYAMLYRCHVEH